MGAAEGTQTPSFQRSYDGTTATLNQARLDLTALLIAQGLATKGHDTLVADAQLVLSELISNAVDASPGEPYRVAASIQDDHVSLEVTNSSAADLPSRQEWGPDDVLALRGRGLAIVHTLSDTVEVMTTGAEVTIVARLLIRAA